MAASGQLRWLICAGTSENRVRMLRLDQHPQEFVRAAVRSGR